LADSTERSTTGATSVLGRDGWSTPSILRAALLVFAVYYALKLLWISSDLVLLVFLGVLFGLAVSAGVDQLSRLGFRQIRLPRGVWAAVIVLGFYAALVGTAAVIGPALAEQGVELKQRLPEAVDRIQDWVRQRPGLLSALMQPATPPPPVAAERQGGVTPAESSAERRAAAKTAERTTTQQAAPTDTSSAAQTIIERIRTSFSTIAGYVISFLSSTFTVVAGILVLTALAIYIAADPGTYREGLLAFVPPASRSRMRAILADMATVLRKWLVTQLIAMLVIGVVSTIALLILGVKAAFALGIIAGLLEFVPTIGPILSAVPAIAMGFLDSPQKALVVALAYLIIQQVEGNVLIPLLMQGGVDLPPAATILAQLLMALLFGFLGLMVAVPLLAAIMVPVRRLYLGGFDSHEGAPAAVT